MTTTTTTESDTLAKFGNAWKPQQQEQEQEQQQRLTNSQTLKISAFLAPSWPILKNI